MKIKHRLLFILILFLIVEIHQIKMEDKKLQQKSFDEIFGEKWEEKEEENLEEKIKKIIEIYYKIKEKIKQKGRKYSTKEWGKIEVKISKKLGTNSNYIYKWIKQFGLNQKLFKCHKSKTDEEKIEIVQKFIEMKNEYKQKGKYSTKEWKQNYAEISKKIGVRYGTIEKWKKQFTFGSKITAKEKMEKMKKYWQIKKENPKMNDREIARIMETHQSSISKWKKRIGEGINEE